MSEPLSSLHLARALARMLPQRRYGVPCLHSIGPHNLHDTHAHCMLRILCATQPTWRAKAGRFLPVKYVDANTAQTLACGHVPPRCSSELRERERYIYCVHATEYATVCFCAAAAKVLTRLQSTEAIAIWTVWTHTNAEEMLQHQMRQHPKPIHSSQRIPR